jgi:ribosomal protein S27AE
MCKRSLIAGIAKGKCPRCRQGEMFVNHAYSLKKGSFVVMHERCPKCDYRFSMEPGFFIGASYVNYAFFIVILLSNYFAGRILFGNVDSTVIFFSVLGFVLILFPVLFRYSRVVYSYSFSGVKYDPQLVDKK